jgi:hypothetical protein
MAKPIAEDDIEASPVPGHRNYLVYCDESGIDGQVYYGFGSLWLPWERRGDLIGLVNELRGKHRYKHEIKWTAVNRHTDAFYGDLVEAFFTKTWLMFHCVIVRKGYVDRELHKDFDEARRKHFAMLLKSKVKFFSGGARDKSYHVRVDPLPSRYEKADEAALKIVGATLKKELGIAPLRSLVTVDSKTSIGVQLSDFFLGAAMADWQKNATSAAKKQVGLQISSHLGWNDLIADTPHSEWKFNIWYFFDPTSGKKRETKTRSVKLKIAMPPFRPRPR